MCDESELRLLQSRKIKLLKAAGLSELKKELESQPPKRVLELCMRLAKHKKENKELLTYLLYEADNEPSYIKSIKEDVDLQFNEMNKSNFYFAKKSLRKILRLLNKYSRYSGSKQTEAELLLYFCRKLKDSGISIHKSQILINMYDRQIFKIKAALSKMHEDLQYDYQKELEELI